MTGTRCLGETWRNIQWLRKCKEDGRTSCMLRRCLFTAGEAEASTATFASFSLSLSLSLSADHECWVNNEIVNKHAFLYLMSLHWDKREKSFVDQRTSQNFLFSLFPLHSSVFANVLNLSFGYEKVQPTERLNSSHTDNRTQDLGEKCNFMMALRSNSLVSCMIVMGIQTQTLISVLDSV